MGVLLCNSFKQKTPANMADIQKGATVKVKVIKIIERGAIVSFNGGKNAFLHISELSDDFVKNVEDVVQLGQEVTVKVKEIGNGKVYVSLKEVKSEEEEKQEFEDKLQKFLKESKENQISIQKSQEKKRGGNNRRFKK